MFCRKKRPLLIIFKRGFSTSFSTNFLQIFYKNVDKSGLASYDNFNSLTNNFENEKSERLI